MAKKRTAKGRAPPPKKLKADIEAIAELVIVSIKSINGIKDPRSYDEVYPHKKLEAQQLLNIFLNVLSGHLGSCLI